MTLADDQHVTDVNSTVREQPPRRRLSPDRSARVGLFVLRRPLTTLPSMNAVPPPGDDVIAFGLIVVREAP